jgi:hypothetical protein
MPRCRSASPSSSSGSLCAYALSERRTKVHSGAAESPKYEQAAMRWRYLTEGEPQLQHFAEVVASLAGRDPDAEPN